MNKILNKLKQYIDENLEIHEILNPGKYGMKIINY